LNKYLKVTVAVLGYLSGIGAAAASDADRLLRLMPQETHHFILVSHFSELWEAGTDHSDDPEVEDAARGRAPDIVTAAKEFEDRFGLPPAQLAEMAPSAVLHAERVGSDRSAQAIVLARVPDPDRAASLLAAVRRNLEQQDTHAGPVQLEGNAGTQFTWRPGTQAGRTVVHAIVNDLLICATDASWAAAAVKLIASPTGASVESLPGWNRIAVHLRGRRRSDRPSLMWYSNPWPIVPSNTSDEAEWDAWAERHGLKGIQGVGGIVTTMSDGSTLAQTVIAAPPPRKSSLQMLQVTPAEQWNAPDWLCSEFDELVLLHGNVAEAFEHFGTLFDDLYADGIDGTYDAILEDLQDEDGLNFDMKAQLYRHLGPSVLLLRHSTPNEQSDDGGPISYAFQTSRQDLVAEAVRTLFAEDPEAQEVRVPGCQEPMWLLAGLDGEPDSGVTVTRGYLVYAEDVATLRRALTVEAGTGPGLASVIDDLRRSVPSLRKRQPCMLWLNGQEASSREASTRLGVAHLFLSAAATRPDMETLRDADFSDLVAEFAPMLQHFSTGLGFIEEDGWSLFVR
jgi:hypothetical protein